MLRAKYIRNAPDGNGTLFRGDIYQVPMNGLLGGTTGQRIWEVNTVAQYSVGTRLVTEDGRVFRYAKASNIVSVRHFGLKFWRQIGDGIATTVASTQAVGDTTFKIADGTAAKDDYVGGYVTFFSTPVQARYILGNTVSDGTYITVTLAEPLTAVITSGSTYTEVLHNPYSDVRLTAGPSGGDSGTDWTSVAGIPYMITTVANTYLWIQTWGPCWVNPHGASLATVTNGERKLVFDCEGSVCVEDDVAHGPGANTDEHQIAGFIIDRNASGSSGPPLVMLTISP